MNQLTFRVVKEVLFGVWKTQKEVAEVIWPNLESILAQSNFSTNKKRGLEIIKQVLEQPDINQLGLPEDQLRFYRECQSVLGPSNTFQRIVEKAASRFGRRSSASGSTQPVRRVSRRSPRSSSRSTSSDGRQTPPDGQESVANVLARQPLAGFMNHAQEHILWAALLNPDGASLDIDRIAETAQIVRGAVEPTLKGAFKTLQELMNAEAAGSQLNESAKKIIDRVRTQWPNMNVEQIKREIYRWTSETPGQKAHL